MAFEFIVVENPTIARRIDISVSGKASKKLEMIWRGMDIDDAVDLLEQYQRESAFWHDEEGEPLTLDAAANDFIFVRGTDGNDIPVPRLHDYATERKLRERLTAQQDFLRGVIQSDDGWLVDWNLAIAGETQDFRQPDVYEMVFKSNEFFFPVLADFVEMLGEISGGKDKEKNLKNSAKSSPPRRGQLRA